jgi:hypothetical protein
MEYRRSVEEAQRRVEGASAPRPAPEPVKPAVSVVEPARPQAQAIMVEDTGLEGAGLERPQAGDVGGGKSPMELVIERAMNMLRNREYIDMLRGMPQEVIEAFIRDAERLGWRRGAIERSSWSMPDEYVKYGLLGEAKDHANKLKTTPIGRVLIDAAQPLRGAGRG